ncbi:vitamin B6 photo-protection and homoeostasis-domain-containing protein [Aspergillus flavus]|uniref:Vitamin B6 photo-protection and homoeostasis-domain-containing protein n=1 Tax=Aspergillus flavus (strain ATCC 200026 / FGSC A1120 / IAM 13836 / NRRL 3357 / JCM 12722 / SRRC 167) TaxID=332952 RepID=A0A7U2MDY9_ASPFN|nr:vitamin B6 photo-protection and homoeostasis-domain-containing protein [Aspergillus flavus]
MHSIDNVQHPSSKPQSWSLSSLTSLLVEVFLPAGYPHSVSDDYVPYQIFDSLQAFSSSIAGLLSSRAVLQGVGVGNADASPTAALLLHILQDTSGRISTILFAHRVGTALEPECKMYRLAADVFNDAAMILDCLSPMIPAGFGRVTVLSTAGVLRALCGVAGGSSKASLSAHFSRWGNLAEVNAKDSSQETIISLIGMLVGSFVVSRVTSYTATWISLVMLLTMHLSLNYAAVRSVQMTSLNRQRANIHSKATQSQKQWQIPTPAQVSKQEKIFETDGILRWVSAPSTQHKLGTCRIGVSLEQFLAPSSTRTGSGSLKTSTPMSDLSSLFKSEDYLLFLHRNRQSWDARILLKTSSTTQTQLKAWMHVLLAARVLCSSAKEMRTQEIEYIMDTISKTLTFLNDGSRTDQYMSALTEAGWDLNVAALETRSGRRIACT